MRPEAPSEQDQLTALTPELMRGYADGRLTWSGLRSDFGIIDFGLVLRRLGELDLRLPRASADRPTEARAWLRRAIVAMPPR